VRVRDAGGRGADEGARGRREPRAVQVRRGLRRLLQGAVPRPRRLLAPRRHGHRHRRVPRRGLRGRPHALRPQRRRVRPPRRGRRRRPAARPGRDQRRVPQVIRSTLNMHAVAVHTFIFTASFNAVLCTTRTTNGRGQSWSTGSVGAGGEGELHASMRRLPLLETRTLWTLSKRKRFYSTAAFFLAGPQWYHRSSRSSRRQKG
jgi:hypothetical protein